MPKAHAGRSQCSSNVVAGAHACACASRCLHGWRSCCPRIIRVEALVEVHLSHLRRITALLPGAAAQRTGSQRETEASCGGVRPGEVRGAFRGMCATLKGVTITAYLYGQQCPAAGRCLPARAGAPCMRGLHASSPAQPSPVQVPGWPSISRCVSQLPWEPACMPADLPGVHALFVEGFGSPCQLTHACMHACLHACTPRRLLDCDKVIFTTDAQGLIKVRAG